MDNQAVWDELHDQQSREIEEHLKTSQLSNSHTVGHPGEILKQTLESIRSVASAATASWNYQDQQQQQQNQQQQGQYQPLRRLDDFGLPTTNHGEPLLYSSTSSQASAVNNQRRDFVFLQQFRLRPKRNGWSAVGNLDLFYTSLYRYYHHRGLVPMIGKGLVELVSLFVTLWLSVILFVYIDWSALATCKDETSCRNDFMEYIVPLDFSFKTIVVSMYCILFATYGLVCVVGFYSNVTSAWQSKVFFEDVLGISARRLEGGAVDWERDVVAKMLALQQSGDYRFAVHDANLDPLVMTQRIMRRENFLLAMINCNILDLSVPYVGKELFCKTIEWSLYFCVLNYMFNHKFHVRPAFFLDPGALRRRFILCGIVHALFMPFLAFFVPIHFLIQNVYDWKSTQQYMGPKEWSILAKWKFRELNELPHFFERRLGPSYEAADSYIKLFKQGEIFTALARILTFVGGSLGAVLLVLAAMNDAILLHVKLGPWNLVWYAGVMGAVFAVGKSMLPDSTRHTRNLLAEMDAALERVAVHTRYFPNHWKKRGWDKSTKAAITGMFNNKANIFLGEMVALICSPILLCISLPRSAEKICEFVMTTKAEVAGAGDICGFATFNFDLFGDDLFEGKTMGQLGMNSVLHTVNELNDIEAAIESHPKPKTKHGKMEKSFFTFKACFPNWKPTKSGQTLYDKVEAFKREQSRAFVREQQLYARAAARQLDTMAMLQDQQEDDGGLPTVIDESYFATRNQPDAGGGVALFPAPEQSGTLHYANTHLSTELRRVLELNRSTTLDPSSMMLGKSLAVQSMVPEEGEEMHFWLQKYHESKAEQQNWQTMSHAPQNNVPVHGRGQEELSHSTHF